MTQKTYLGDGAYVEFVAGRGFVLTTDDGIHVTNRIVLEPDVAAALVRFIAGFMKAPTETSPVREGSVRAAHLIAAAPAMLAALHVVAHHADDEAGFMVDVRAAIAQAEGRS